jgi:protoporphyrinogen IX oxidase
MLWLKALHIVFVVTWFAGIFYLPRLFMYHAAATDALSIERFQTMEQRLFGIMTIGATLTVLFGISLLIVTPGFLQAGWLHAKLTLVLLLIGYHAWCYRLMRDLRAGRKRSSTWYRVFNEVPSVLLIAIVILVVVKPF